MNKIVKEIIASESERKIYNSVISILRKTDSPICIDTLSFVLNIPSYKACRILRKLEKWNMAKPVTCTKTTYWRLTER